MDYLNIQEEKAKAMTRYRRLRSITKMRRILEILLALAFFSWSSTRLPSLLDLVVKFLVNVYKYLITPHITFLIGNAIIAVVVVLSRKNTAGNAPTVGGDDAFDFSSELIPPPPAPPTLAAETEGTETETACVDKEVVVTENAVREVQCYAVEEEEGQNQKVARRSFERAKSAAAAEEGQNQNQKVTRRSFERAKSEKLTKRGSAQGRILRRSETLVVSSPSDERRVSTSSFDSVEKLSNEDFQRAIEDVIAEHRRVLSAQRMHEIE